MLVNMKCPSCGATMQFDDSMASMDCPYCGGKVANVAEQVNITQNVNVSGTVVHVQDRSNDPNLFITYNTNNPSVGMVSRIVSTGVKGTYVNGQTLSYHLSQGPQTIILKIGKKNYSRDVVIPPDNQPVRIYASFNGRAQISVDQPNIQSTPTGVSAGGQTSTAPVSAANTSVAKEPGKPKAPLSILAFILSLTFYLSWAGAGLGAVETFVLDKKKEKNHIFSYIAMGIGTFLTLCLILGLGGGSGSKKADATATTTTEVVAVATTTEETTEATTTTTTTAATEETEAVVDEGNTEVNDSGEVTPELKAYLDSYEEYMDSYIEFMKKMAEDPNDITVITEYANMVAKYNEFAKAIEEYDVDEMSEADRQYYIEVTTRVSTKLMEANVEIANT